MGEEFTSLSPWEERDREIEGTFDRAGGTASYSGVINELVSHFILLDRWHRTDRPERKSCSDFPHTEIHR